MRIGIFVVCAGRQAGGPETYERSLVRELAAMDARNEYHIYCTDRAAIESFDVRQPNVRFHELWPRSRWISVPVSLPLNLYRHRIDVYHATLVPAPFSPVNCVFTMHDITPIACPHFYPRAIRLRLRPLIERGLANAKLILFISESARDTAAELFGLPSERLAVVHHGVNEQFRPVARAEAEESVRSRHGLAPGYLLYVGKLEPRKNIVRLLEAYHRLRNETKCEAKLVLAGRRMWHAEFIDDALDRFDLRDHVVELGYVPDADLPALYTAATAFVFPTLWEGFGFPVLEAMACGTPVITSNVSSLPEISGDAALLVDPYSAEDIAGAMHRLLEDGTLRQSLSRKGRARAAEFTWRRAAQQTLQVYERAASL